jgi:Ca2+-binding RTX toxin-like protein
MVQAPSGFGDFANDLLVGNFGDGRIHAFDPTTGQLLGTITPVPGHGIVIDGLWGLAFGNGGSAGDANTLYYSAGPDGETHGLFGKITANAVGTNPVTIQQTGTDLTIMGSRGDDNVQVQTTDHNRTIVVKAGGQTLGTFANASIVTIHFSGFAGNDTLNVNSHVKAAVIADGGAGDDRLTGGGSSDLLVGGTGRDKLSGQASSDILIGGSTTYDMAALTQIANVWFGPGGYEEKVAAIRGGTSVPERPGTNSPALDATTVIDDGVRDDFDGGTGRDWFFGTGPDHLPKLGNQAHN